MQIIGNHVQVSAQGLGFSVSQRDWEIFVKITRIPPPVFFPMTHPTEKRQYEKDVNLCSKFLTQDVTEIRYMNVCFFSTSIKKTSIFLHFLILSWYEFTVQQYGGENEVQHISPSTH